MPRTDEALLASMSFAAPVSFAHLLDWMDNYYPPRLIKARDVALLLTMAPYISSYVQVRIAWAWHVHIINKEAMSGRSVRAAAYGVVRDFLSFLDASPDDARAILEPLLAVLSEYLAALGPEEKGLGAVPCAAEQRSPLYRKMWSVFIRGCTRAWR